MQFINIFFSILKKNKLTKSKAGGLRRVGRLFIGAKPNKISGNPF